MPLVDTNDPAVWDSLYEATTGNGRVVHYTREAKQQYLGNDHLRLKEALDLQPGQRIALVGAGFGWIAEDWIDAGLTVIAVDTSDYIHERKGREAQVEVLNHDPRNTIGRRGIRQALGLTGNTKLDWVITEDVLPILSDAECLQYAPPLRGLAKKVAHWVSLGIRRYDDPNVWAGDPRLNWKALEDWKALMTPDLVVSRQGGVVL